MSVSLRFYRDWPIPAKLWFSFGLLVFAIACIGTVSYWQIQKIDQKVDILTRVETALEVAVLDLELSTSRAAEAVYRYLIDGSQLQRHEYRAARAELEQHFQILEELHTRELEPLWNEFSQVYATFVRSADRLMLISQRQKNLAEGFQTRMASLSADVRDLVRRFDSDFGMTGIEREQALELGIFLSQLGAVFDSYVLGRRMDAPQEVYDLYGDYLQGFNTRRPALAGSDSWPWFEEIQGRTGQIVTELLELISSHQRALQVYGNLESYRSSLYNLLEYRMQPRIQKSALQAAMETREATNFARMLLVLLGIFSFVIGALSAWRISQSIIRPIRLLFEAMERISRGALRHRVRIDTRDELGRLAEGLNRMVESLSASTTRLATSEKSLQQLSEKLLSVQDQERQRISSELHDELNQSLAALKLQVRFIERGLEPSQKQLQEHCEELREYISDIIENVRRISRDLSPVALDELGLTAAIEGLAQSLFEGTDTRVHLDLMQVEGLLSRQACRVVYRVLQEALTNIHKYARASRILVRIARDDANVLFVVEDDGRGFDSDQIMRPRSVRQGLGLAAMPAQVRMLGGTISIQSNPGEGTHIEFRIPVQEGAPTHGTSPHYTG